MNTITWSPGSLVRARGREWIVLNGGSAETLRVRPVAGSEDDAILIHLPLEAEPVSDAAFPPPTLAQRASQDGAQLLRDALTLSMRRGAGPFRGFGQISIQPRAYQLVPLMMALRQETVRLLVADDVGVGKTIEAALIVRELLDRGDVDRFSVLCPPHLVEQWVHELDVGFHLRAVAVTAANASRLEKAIPQTTSLFEVHPFTVVSLDYIKSQNRRDEFLRSCPGFVIVDEAHTCAATGQGRHQRYELLRALSQRADRHLVLLTATPHSGDEAGFYRLLGLLDPAFQRLEVVQGDERNALRERLARHFVQRRRPDLDEWREGELFPDRQTRELTYTLSGAWERFFDAVLDYCATVIESASGDARRQRLNFWGTLALMRCVASSPRAAVQALRTHATPGEEAEAELEERLFDGGDDALPEDDLEPPAATGDADLQKLIAQAEELSGQSGDPKLKTLVGHVKELLGEDFAPVVFCRYIATAHYLGAHLAKQFPDVMIKVVTGELTQDERREAVAALRAEEGKVLLIATDCLSEGVNLQESFNAVIHYDLSWNPMRHEQREGRVDRYLQSRPVVRATLLYGQNNPVDGAVLEVILRKAERIRRELGVPVPLPDEGHSLTQTLMRAVLLKHRKPGRQAMLDFGGDAAATIEATWQSAAERAQKNRTVFAQKRLRPGDVLPEYERVRQAIGGREDVERFVSRAMARLGAAPERLKRGVRLQLAALPAEVRERLENEGLAGSLLVDFEPPGGEHRRLVQRAHPLVAVLAETLLERTLTSAGDGTSTDPSVLGRLGCWESSGVTERTTVVLLHPRHQLTTVKGSRTHTLLVEESTAVSWGASGPPREGAEALALLALPPAGDPPAHVRDRELTRALALVESSREQLAAVAEGRAQALLADHRRVREAAGDRGSYSVKALLPVDVIGVFVLLPEVK
ncbi:DEAD/DEAH box helicase [Corallococcus interemptor]|uniref:helicase-related protein n=1 Tax=Corallococcus TaxID=83461 RepID=UPI001CBB363A|nr:helicase-related protein [Corallococcus sp. AS-1-6]MBZ4372326.1 DEAD/DEAH box helicase [Corallococcus sp. AS-1-6]